MAAPWAPAACYLAWPRVSGCGFEVQQGAWGGDAPRKSSVRPARPGDDRRLPRAAWPPRACSGRGAGWRARRGRSSNWTERSVLALLELRPPLCCSFPLGGHHASVSIAPVRSPLRPHRLISRRQPALQRPLPCSPFPSHSLSRPGRLPPPEIPVLKVCHSSTLLSPCAPPLLRGTLTSVILSYVFFGDLRFHFFFFFLPAPKGPPLSPLCRPLPLPSSDALGIAYTHQVWEVDTPHLSIFPGLSHPLPLASVISYMLMLPSPPVTQTHLLNPEVFKPRGHLHIPRPPQIQNFPELDPRIGQIHGLQIFTPSL